MKKRDTFLPYGKQWLDDDDIEGVVKTLKGDFLTTGPSVEAFEEKVADYTGAKYAVSFSNGTAALHAACYAAGIEVGDEVITTPITFAASANCVLYQGGTPVFADIDPQTYNIDPNEIEKKITPRTKAIIPVDFTGQPVDLNEICALAKRHKLLIIEDAAHALGATYQGQKIGSIADMTMFSFHPVKPVTTGEGGVITTHDKELYEKLKLFRSHGITRDPKRLMNNHGPWYYEMQSLGYNYRLTDIQAVLGITQMNKLDTFIKRRITYARMYTEAFQSIEGLTVPYQKDNRESGWHLYILRWDTKYFNTDRKTIFEALKARNIGVNVHYIPVHSLPYYQDLGYEIGICPHAEAIYEEIITLPLFPKMTEADVRDVIEAVRDVVVSIKEEGVE